MDQHIDACKVCGDFTLHAHPDVPLTAIRWEIRENDFMDDLEVWEGDRQIACHLKREDAEVIVAAQALLDVLFEIRDDCAEIHEGDDLLKLAYRVVEMANGAINSVLAACAKREE
jgi:hypothetical protein